MFDRRGIVNQNGIREGKRDLGDRLLKELVTEAFQRISFDCREQPKQPQSSLRRSGCRWTIRSGLAGVETIQHSLARYGEEKSSLKHDKLSEVPVACSSLKSRMNPSRLIDP
jgi:hypothetical protein